VRLIPALDLAGGAVVRLEGGDFNRARRYADSPDAWLERFAVAGARRVHLVDLDAARDGVSANAPAIERLIERGGPLGIRTQVAGGIRSLARARAWLDRGAARVVVGSAAAERPAEVVEWLRELGGERLTLAFDVRRSESGAREVATHGWLSGSGVSLAEAVAPFAAAGLRHALSTAIERDGLLGGPDLELCLETSAAAPAVAWQASGGVRSAADLEALAAAGAAGAIVGRALLDGLLPLLEISRWSRNGSSPAST